MMLRFASFLIILSLFLQFIDYPITELIGSIMLLVIVLGGLFIMLGGKSGDKFFGHVIFFLVLVLVVSPTLYEILANAVSQISQKLHQKVSVPSLWQIPVFVFFLFLLLSLLTMGIRSRLNKSNRRKRADYEKSMYRRAKITERKRAVPEALGKSNRDKEQPTESQLDDDDPFDFFPEE